MKRKKQNKKNDEQLSLEIVIKSINVYNVRQIYERLFKKCTAGNVACHTSLWVHGHSRRKGKKRR